MSHEDLTSLTSPQRFRTESGPSSADTRTRSKFSTGFGARKALSQHIVRRLGFSA